MSYEEVIFYFVATVTVISALGVVTARNIVHSALFLILSLISVAGITKEVTFEPADAYHAKYKGSSYLSPMTGTRARSTTVKVTPR